MDLPGRGGGGFLLEPGTNLAGVAAEHRAGLADVGGEEERRRAHRRHRQHEVGQRHLSLSLSLSSLRAPCGVIGFIFFSSFAPRKRRRGERGGEGGRGSEMGSGCRVGPEQIGFFLSRDPGRTMQKGRDGLARSPTKNKIK